MSSASPPPIPPPTGLNCASLQAVILSAGEAKRAGGINKSFMRVEGRTILEHQMDRLRPVFGDRIAVITNRPSDYATRSVSVLPDLGLEPDNARKSSLAGMAAILSAFPDRWCFSMPCDMPFPNMEVLELEIRHLRSASEKSLAPIAGICLRDDKHLRPYHSLLHGSLGPDALEAFKACQARGGEISTRDWMETRRDLIEVHHRVLGVSQSVFEHCIQNFNRPLQKNK